MKRLQPFLLIALLVGAFLFTLSISSVQATAETPSARDIAVKARDKQFPENSVSDITMILINKRGNKRTRKISTKRKTYEDEEAKSVAYFLSPADVKGTAFLVWEHKDTANDVFIYLPALKKIRRIASEQKNQSFMGSDFSYADMEKEDVDAATYQILREEDLDGKRCWVIEALPTPDSDSEYGKWITWVSQENYIPQKVEFYDKKGKLFKVMHVLKIGPVGDDILPLHFTMENIQKKHKTEIVIDEIKLNESISDREFTHRAIQR